MLTKSNLTVCHLSTKIVRMICACVTGFIKTIVASTVISSVRSSCDELARNTHLGTYIFVCSHCCIPPIYHFYMHTLTYIHSHCKCTNIHVKQLSANIIPINPIDFCVINLVYNIWRVLLHISRDILNVYI